MNSLYFLLPEIFIFIMSVILLMTGLFVKKIKIINYIAILSIVIAVVIILNQSFQSILQNSFIIDEFSKIFKVMILIGSAASLVMFFSSKEDQHINFYEFPILILFSTIGMMVMVSSNDLLLMFIGLELQSLGLYVLACLLYTSDAADE